MSSIVVHLHRRTLLSLGVAATLLSLSAAAQAVEPIAASGNAALAAEPVTEVAAATPAAEPAKNSVAQIETVNVVGARKKTSEVAEVLEKFGNQVQVVKAEEIAAAGYTNMAEIAQGLIRGANIGYSPDEGEFTIRLDGGGDRDTLVTLDGVPLYDRGPGVENIWGATLIDPHMVETIEVFRGGQSLYFGSNAGIGLVNVITKKPNGQVKGELGLSYGSFNTREIWGNYSFPLDDSRKHSLMLYGGRTASDNQQIFRRESQTDNHLRAGGITDYASSRDNIGVKYLWSIDSASDLLVNLQYVQIDFQDTFPDGNIYGPTRSKMPLVNAEFNRDWTPWLRTQVTASYRKPELLNTKFELEVCRLQAGCTPPNSANPSIPFGQWTGGFVAQRMKGVGDQSVPAGFEELVVTALNFIKVNDSISAVVGAQSTNYRDASDQRVTISDDLFSDNALIADLQFTPSFSPMTSISIAGRVDNEQSIGTKTVGKFGIRQGLPGGVYARINGGNSFSLPQTNELFANAENIVGNPDLKAEKTRALNYGIGVDRPFGDHRVSAELGGFYTDISNRIQTTQGLTPNTYFNNEGVTEIRGVVADLQVSLGLNWQLALSYTQQDAQLENTSNQVNAVPKWFATGNLRWSSDDKHYHFSLLPRLQGPEYINVPVVGGTPVAGLSRLNYGEWFLLNASAQYWMGDDLKHRFQLRLVNILDEEYGERGAIGNQRFGSAAVRGEIDNRDAEYYIPYTFYGKPRSVFVTYNYQF